MKAIKYFLILAIAVLGFSFTDVKAQKSQSSLQGVERQVFKELIGLPNYGLFDHISYQVDGGTVTLYGKVLSLGTRKTAERVVERIAGVDNVVNNIENLPPSSFDNSIRYQLVRTFQHPRRQFVSLSAGANPSMRIIVDGGRVTLEGYVRSRGDSRLANILANGVPNVFQVTNNLQIEREDR